MNNLDEKKIPDRCPNCKAVKKNILLHIGRREDCNSAIGQELLKKWRKVAYKIKKRKYQRKYTKSGKHKKHQANYIEKLNKEDKESVLKVQRRKSAKSLPVISLGFLAVYIVEFHLYLTIFSRSLGKRHY